MGKSPFRSDCLEGKVALVTGGGSGIGFEISKQLLCHGCAGVVICGRRKNFLEKASRSLNQASAGRKCLFFQLDVRDADACAAAVKFTMKCFHRLDIVVNGAAGNFLVQAKSLSPKGFRTVMDIDAMGTFNMSHAAHSSLAAKNNCGGGGGLIINITATLQYGATWYQCHASAAKSAVDSLTRSFALEWGCDNIRVVGIAPGPIADTPGTTKLAPGLEEESSLDVMEGLVAERIPLGRMGKAFELGMAAVFLSSDAGSFITGDTLVVDGGEWLYRPPMVPKDMVAELSRRVEAKSRAKVPRLTSNL